MKKRLLSLLLLAPASLWAQQNKTWVMVDADNSATCIPIDRISYLITADMSADFSAVCLDGTAYCGIRTAAFKQIDPAAIAAMNRSDEVPVLTQPVHEQLVLTGCAEGTPVTLFTLDGKTAARTTAQADDTVIPVSPLPAGVYILKAGKTSIKFTKK